MDLISGNEVVTITESKDIVEWEQDVTRETNHLVKSGHNNLIEIIELVSQRTKKQEHVARKASMEEYIEITKNMNRIAMQNIDPEFHKISKQQSHQIDQIVEEMIREGFDKKFTERKIKLIEKRFNEALESQKKANITGH